MDSFPSQRLRRFFWVYGMLWVIGLPFALIYLMLRARKDPLYIKHLRERFGFYPTRLEHAVWCHAVSLGEVRSAVPLLQKFLADGEPVVITVFTPAGRREADKVFARDIARGAVCVVWVPLEYRWCYRRFFRQFSPRLGLVMEVEVWPVMIHASHLADVPLFQCNAQYPEKSFRRDQQNSKWRADVIAGYTGAFVKSDLQRDRFAAVGLDRIDITGELRFDQPIPADLTRAAARLKPLIKRRVITITSVVEGEDDTYIALIKACAGTDAPLFVYVPRAPERFDETAALLQAAGLRVARRTEILTQTLAADAFPDCDVLLGDSMGEMYFYLGLCDQALTGGSFHPKGAHNISEALSMGKPVILGPHVWPIAFPFKEAHAAGVATHVMDLPALIAHVKTETAASSSAVAAFFETQAGAVGKTYDAIQKQVPRDGGRGVFDRSASHRQL